MEWTAVWFLVGLAIYALGLWAIAAYYKKLRDDGDVTLMDQGLYVAVWSILYGLYIVCWIGVFFGEPGCGT